MKLFNTDLRKITARIAKKYKEDDIKKNRIAQAGPKETAAQVEAGISDKAAIISTSDSRASDIRSEAESVAKRNSAINSTIQVAAAAVMAAKTIYFREQQYQNYASGAGQAQLRNEYTEAVINKWLILGGSAIAIGSGVITGNPVTVALGAIALTNQIHSMGTASRTNTEQVNRDNYQRSFNALLYGFDKTLFSR